ncbi:MAG: hypothetical protein ACI3XA_00920 [Clostridia bacterium]
MKKRFLIPACVMLIAAIGFVIYGMWHPEMSFPWSSRITGIVYGLYADLMVLMFILAFCKKVTLLNILTIVFELGSIFVLVQGIFGLSPDGHTNWCLPLALVLNCIAVFLNATELRKQQKSRKRKNEGE